MVKNYLDVLEDTKTMDNVKHPLYLMRCPYAKRLQHFRHQELCMEDDWAENAHVPSVQGSVVRALRYICYKLLQLIVHNIIF
jgi:hypothetical protein